MSILIRSKPILKNSLITEGQKYADFYPVDWGNDEVLIDFHKVPVHSIVKLNITDKVELNWIDPDWLKKLFEQNTIRIRHENNGRNILLTAKPQELQKFLIKYSDEQTAYEDGMYQELERMN